MRSLVSTANMFRLFNQEAGSDMTINFGRREVKYHRLILCNVSEYFKAQCESGNTRIELRNDDLAAVAARLRYIYNFDYAQLRLSPHQPVQTST